MITHFSTNQAIIIGDAHHNTLGLIRSLGIKGIHPIVFIISPEKQSGCIKSKYVKAIVYFDNEKLAVQKLVEEIPNLTSKAVLYASSDAASCEIDARYEELKDYYCFFNAQGRLRELMNKEVMCKIAEQSGLTVPERILYGKGDKTPENVVFPCITKAISSLEGSKSNISICHNKIELQSSLSRQSLCNTIQIEEYIDKEFEFQFIGLSLNEGETVVIPGHSHIIRPNGIDNTFFFEYLQNSEEFTDTIESAKQFIRDTKYSGLFSMEFLHSKNGKNYFLEMNFRNDGNAICVTDAGFNLPYIWWLYSTNNDYQNEISNSKYRNTFFCPEFTTMLDCVHGEISAIKYCSVYLKANSYTNYYKNDNNGYWYEYIKEFIKQVVVKRLLVKMHLYKK